MTEHPHEHHQDTLLTRRQHARLEALDAVLDITRRTQAALGTPPANVYEVIALADYVLGGSEDRPDPTIDSAGGGPEEDEEDDDDEDDDGPGAVPNRVENEPTFDIAGGGGPAPREDTWRTLGDTVLGYAPGIGLIETAHPAPRTTLRAGTRGPAAGPIVHRYIANWPAPGIHRTKPRWRWWRVLDVPTTTSARVAAFAGELRDHPERDTLTEEQIMAIGQRMAVLTGQDTGIPKRDLLSPGSVEHVITTKALRDTTRPRVQVDLGPLANAPTRIQAAATALQEHLRARPERYR